MTSSDNASETMPVEITEQDFANYLRQNPDFFERHPSLLSQLVVPHPQSGQAVSLLERKVIIMREQQEDSQRQLSELIKNARNNEKLIQGIDQFSVQLLSVKELEYLSRKLSDWLRENFNPEFLAVMLNVDKSLLGLLGDADSCTCTTNLPESTLRKIFRSDSNAIKSVAAIPLRYSDLGVIVFGSSDHKRYANNSGTRYLDQLQRLLNTTLTRLSG